MSTIILSMQADEVRWGKLVPAHGALPALQMGEVLRAGRVVAFITVAWPSNPEQLPMLCQVQPRHAGPQD